ncbi:hypothetical protein SAMN04490244_11116 [Tranquillimonas rosea]|uniref:Uncharacterized protein n=1 Tax=Tranquillimonas rosea TaxID=641238 RepID=A0A1H9WIM3_9RHOB|nr:hypothetical protein [Tranquillimonas rosea]SES33728.1 hypothetical protein SAMN04490244_11116 [Tranquillimonas rosea]
MPNMRNTIARMWDDLNPKEPSPYYLVKLMSVIIGAFAFGLIVHFLRV